MSEIEGNNPETKKQNVKKNKFAIAGFILGILSIFFAWIGVIPLLAVIFSGIGLNANNIKTGGKGYAIAGLSLGILYTLVYLNTYGHLNIY